jgi:hypothetical protein
MRIAVLALLGLAACQTERTLRIDSVPQGALVRLDDEILGRTPLVHEFFHYGTRRVTVYLEGYRTSSEQVELKAPWYAYFPIDLVSEIFSWKDRHHYQVLLEPEIGVVSEVDLQAVLGRAEAFRRATPEGPRFDGPPPVEAVGTGAPPEGEDER